MKFNTTREEREHRMRARRLDEILKWFGQWWHHATPRQQRRHYIKTTPTPW